MKIKMARTGGDLQTKELNALFKALGEEEDEGKEWKELYRLMGDFLQLLEIVARVSIAYRIYGSESENLKCYFPGDIGDMDVMTFMNSDDYIVHEELLEYLPENPLHVRIKGASHPVFKSCLVEGKEYVATSALRNFHPAIFPGDSSPQRLIFMSTFINQFINPRFNRIFLPRNVRNSPAVTMNFAGSFGSISEMFEVARGPNFWSSFDIPAAFDMLGFMICKAFDVDYTRQLADRFKDFGLLVKTFFISLFRGNTTVDIIKEFGRFTFDVFLPELLTLMVDIEDLSRMRKGMDVPEQPQPNSNKDDCITEAGESERIVSANISSGTYEKNHPVRNSESVPDHNNSHFELHTHTASALSKSTVVNPSEQQLKSNQASEGETAQKINVNTGISSQFHSDNPSKVWEFSTLRGVLPFPDSYMYLSGEEGIEEQREGEASKDERRPIESISVDFGIFGKVTLPETETLSKKTRLRESEEAKPYDRVGGIDLVPAFKARGWPKVARDWIKRERKWPSPDIVETIVQEGFHLVVKPPKNSRNPDCDFRISFSHAEYLLSQEMNDIQRECYRCLKKFHRAYLSSQPDSLVTFHLKTILMQTIEETGAETWTENNRSECMMRLFGNLMKALQEKHLSHFFVNSCNLFSEDYIENPEVLETLIVKVEQIMERPIELGNSLIEIEKDAKQSRKRRPPGCQGNLTDSAPTAERQIHNVASVAHEDIQATTQTESTSGDKVKPEMSSLPVLHTEVETSTSNLPCYHDLKDIYLDMCTEFTHLAFTDIGLENVDDSERKLVESLRWHAIKNGADQELFSQLFEIGWDRIYVKIWLRNEGLNIRRMVDEIQDLVDLWREPDVESRNESAALVCDPVDANALLISGFFNSAFKRVITKVESSYGLSNVKD